MRLRARGRGSPRSRASLVVALVALVALVGALAPRARAQDDAEPPADRKTGEKTGEKTAGKAGETPAGDAGRHGATETAPTEKTETAGDSLGAAFPWRAGPEYRYSWRYSGRNVGETRFRIEKLEKPARERAPHFRVHTAYGYRREAHDEKSTRSMLFDSSWSLLLAESATFVDYATNLKSRRSTRAWREGDLFITEAVYNGNEAAKARAELKVSREAMVLVPQAVEIWALTLPRVAGSLRSKDGAELAVAYPEFGRVYEVNFSASGSETIDITKTETVECERFSFSTERRELDGEIWIDAKNRLVRYTQGDLTIQLRGS